MTEGSPVWFGVSAVGAEPITYQWRFNGAPIADETNSTYTIASAQSSNAGTNDVVVTNPFGSVFTTNHAILTVIAIVQIRVTNHDVGDVNPRQLQPEQRRLHRIGRRRGHRGHGGCLPFRASDLDRRRPDRGASVEPAGGGCWPKQA